MGQFGSEVQCSVTGMGWSDDGIINAGREIFSNPVDQSLLDSVEEPERGDWLEVEEDSLGFRVWIEDEGGNEELAAIGTADAQVIFADDIWSGSY